MSEFDQSIPQVNLLELHRTLQSTRVDRDLAEHTESMNWPRQSWRRRLVRNKTKNLLQAVKVLPGYSCLFIDCFDTLVRRTIAPPDAVILETCRLASQILAAELCYCSAENLFKLRRKSYQTVANRLKPLGNDPEPHIQEIWEEALHTLSGHEWPEMARQLTQVEIEVEASVLESMPGAETLLEQARANGMTICVLSDTYYTEHQLRTLLATQKLDSYCDFIFSSSTERKGKYSGKLFTHAMSKLGVAADKVLHIGDSLYSDYRGAKRCGIKVLLLWNKEEERRIELMRNACGVSSRRDLSRHLSYLKSLSAPAPCRLEGSDKVLYQIGFDQAGPAFYSFARHVIDESLRYNIKDVYFLARDGYVIKQIFDDIVAHRGLDLKSHYLHLSRKSSCFLDPKVLIQRVENDSSWPMDLPETISRLIKRCGADGAENIPRPEDFGLTMATLIEPIAGTTNFLSWLRAFSREEAVLRSRAQKELIVVDYLRHTGFAHGDGSVALVDIGWTGTIQQTIYKLLSAMGVKRTVHGFYFGRGAGTGVETLRSDNRVHPGHIYDSVAKGRAVMPKSAFSFVEILAGAPHGSVAGYSEKEGKIVPVFEPLDPREALSEHIREGIRQFCAWYERSRRWEESVVGLRKAASDQLTWFFYNPTRREAEVFARIQFDIGWHAGKHFNILATELSHFKFLQQAVARKLHPSVWAFGALRMRRFPMWAGKIWVFLLMKRRAY